MRQRPRPVWMDWLATAAWLAILASTPWWLGLPLLLSLAAAGLLLQQRLAARHATLIRHALRWGLPGLLLSLQRLFGGALGVAFALLGALAGYTLLAGMDAWLDRDRQREPLAADDVAWPELAHASMGPPAKIIELMVPQWRSAAAGLSDPIGCHGVWQTGDYITDDGRVVNDVDDAIAFSPGGRWMAARLRGQRGVVLCDRRRERSYRLRGWQLCGWHEDEAWLCRREGELPLPLSAVRQDDVGT